MDFSPPSTREQPRIPPSVGNTPSGIFESTRLYGEDSVPPFAASTPAAAPPDMLFPLREHQAKLRAKEEALKREEEQPPKPDKGVNVGALALHLEQSTQRRVAADPKTAVDLPPQGMASSTAPAPTVDLPANTPELSQSDLHPPADQHQPVSALGRNLLGSADALIADLDRRIDDGPPAPQHSLSPPRPSREGQTQHARIPGATMSPDVTPEDAGMRASVEMESRLQEIERRYKAARVEVSRLLDGSTSVPQPPIPQPSRSDAVRRSLEDTRRGIDRALRESSVLRAQSASREAARQAEIVSAQAAAMSAVRMETGPLMETMPDRHPSAPLPSPPRRPQPTSSLRQFETLPHKGGSPEAAAAEAALHDWTTVNNQLHENGFARVPRMADGEPYWLCSHREALLRRVFTDVLYQYERRGQLVQDLVAQVNDRKESESRDRTELVEMKERIEELHHALSSSESRCQLLRESQMEAEHTTSTAVKRLELAVSNLRQKLSAAEHAGRAKDAEMERMQRRLSASVEKEERKASRDRKVFASAHAREPRTRLPSDNHTLDLIHMYEGQREQLAGENDFLRREVDRLNATLKDRENSLRELTAVPRGAAGRDETEFQRLEKEFRLQVEAAKKSESEAKEVAEARVSGMRVEMGRLVSRLEVLELELQSRPTLRELGMTRKRLKEAEAKIAKLPSEPQQPVVPQAPAIRHPLSHSVLGRSYETAALVHFVQDTCTRLDVQAPEDIAPTLDRVSRVMASVPRLERFVRDVCDAAAVVGPSGRSVSMSPDSVPEAIRGWRRDLISLPALKEMRSAVLQGLARRGPGQPGPDSSPQSITNAVVALVDAERDLSRTRELVDGVAESIKADPTAVANRIVAHFQQLFDVKDVMGILPKMNGVYVFLNETSNFLKAFREIMGLDPHASSHACLEAAHALIAKAYSHE